ncbi:FHA domain-containing protein [Conexibacter woesei]|uniref:FHA domain containing protein n=1 Tax=Conexibacter woesei (strain DSM 14684 / CCUG 47730 / CIP 108061 / JCM 11494 / NBRC 100937 / ID131577) TaxID=469383 RepID=D3EYP5_CONWI|nr:FHA domain-containing protein [Conexibacter woesei]ADB48449.1 FHA domain containing protein [Conexibacter woesei DSM 14684]
MTLEPASVALKLGFLAVLYLFLLWIVRSSLKDLRRAQAGGDAAVAEMHAAAPAADATAMHNAADDLLGDAIGDGEPRLVVERAAGHPDGIAYDLARGVTLGRGDVEIRLEDPFASSHHARIERQGSVLVLEDLGSTNGTYLNEEPLRGIQPLHHGDRIRIGDSEFSYLQD